MESSAGTREYKDQLVINASNKETQSIKEEETPFNERIVPECVVADLVSGLMNQSPETLTVLALRQHDMNLRNSKNRNELQRLTCGCATIFLWKMASLGRAFSGENRKAGKDEKQAKC